MSDSVLDCLDRPHVFEILEILENGEAMISDMESICGWRTLDSRLEPLHRAGLISVSEKTEGRRAKLYCLTKDGYRCLYLMRLSRMIISGELDIESQKMIECIDRAIFDGNNNRNKDF